MDIARRIVATIILALTIAWPAAARSAAGPPSVDPERSAVHAGRAMVAAANPHATRAGLAMLRAGGSAVDAAIAVQLMLTLVEPQSSGIGGGGFMMHFDAASGELAAWDGRETAPAAATPDLFLDAQGDPEQFFAALVGGKAVGVPGILRLFETVHKRHGKLPWAKLFEPAIRLAEDGFEVSPRLNYLIGRVRVLKLFETTRNYFFTAAGTPLGVGSLLKNPAYAETLRILARDGAEAFYKGPIAHDIVATVRRAPRNPGLMTEADLAGYEAKKREPVCLVYRRWRVCGMPPPSSGGITTLQILGLLEGFDMAGVAPGSIEAVHLITEASRLAYADRAAYIADSDAVNVPIRGLMDPGYLKDRANLIRRENTMEEVTAGEPPFQQGALPPPGQALELPSTSHFSIVDGEGNVVSMTSSVEFAFGSQLMARGFILNNQLTDFSFVPEVDGVPVANRVQGGKRPLSSMSPTIVFDEASGDFRLAVGSPGGPQIITFVAKTLVGVLDWDLDIQQAISLPNHVARGETLFVEEETALEKLIPGLDKLGHTTRTRNINSGLHGIARRPGGGLVGGADPRREGLALGD